MRRVHIVQTFCMALFLLPGCGLPKLEFSESNFGNTELDKAILISTYSRKPSIIAETLEDFIITRNPNGNLDLSRNLLEQSGAFCSIEAKTLRCSINRAFRNSMSYPNGSRGDARFAWRIKVNQKALTRPTVFVDQSMKVLEE